MADPKGKGLKASFDGSLRLEFHGAKVTSDAGLLAYRDLDEALVLFDSVPSVFRDSRTGRNIQHDLASLLRQSVYSRLAGYEDVNDAHRLSVDPTMRRITGKKMDKKKAASANTMGRFETEILSVTVGERILKQLFDNGEEVVKGANGRKSRKRWVSEKTAAGRHQEGILDGGQRDSAVIEVSGESPIRRACSSGRMGKFEIIRQEGLDMSATLDGSAHLVFLRRAAASCSLSRTR